MSWNRTLKISLFISRRSSIKWRSSGKMELKAAVKKCDGKVGGEKTLREELQSFLENCQTRPPNFSLILLEKKGMPPSPSHPARSVTHISYYDCWTWFSRGTGLRTSRWFSWKKEACTRALGTPHLYSLLSIQVLHIGVRGPCALVVITAVYSLEESSSSHQHDSFTMLL